MEYLHCAMIAYQTSFLQSNLNFKGYWRQVNKNYLNSLNTIGFPQGGNKGKLFALQLDVKSNYMQLGATETAEKPFYEVKQGYFELT